MKAFTCIIESPNRVVRTSLLVIDESQEKALESIKKTHGEATIVVPPEEIVLDPSKPAIIKVGWGYTSDDNGFDD